MLRYETETRPGLVTLYDIRLGNGAGLFLQPRSPHGASNHVTLWLEYGKVRLLLYSTWKVTCNPAFV